MGRAWNRAKPDIGFCEVGYSPVKPSCIENSFDNLEVNANAEQEDEIDIALDAHKNDCDFELLIEEESSVLYDATLGDK